jgi:hypothetical protein
MQTGVSVGRDTAGFVGMNVGVGNMGLSMMQLKATRIVASVRKKRKYFFISLLLNDLFDPSHLPIHQADLDAVRMIWRLGENILDDAFGQFACALILFQDDQHGHAGFDAGAGLSVHPVTPASIFQIQGIPEYH